MKKLFAGILISSTILGFGTTSVSAEQNIVGTPDATVPVEGQVGFDNTVDPSVPPVDPDEMINVVLPTKVLFNTTKDSGHTEITSPTFKVTNNSAWTVKIDIESLDNVDLKNAVADLSLKDGDGTEVPLITDGTAMTSAINDWITLDANKNVNPSGINEVTYTFSGTATPSTSPEVPLLVPTFDMVLKLEAVNPNL